MIEYWLVHFLLSLFSAADSPLHWPKLPPPHPQSLHSPKNLHLHHPPPFVCVSSSPLPYPAWGERTVLIQAGVEGGGGGESLLSGPPPLCQGPLGHQHDNVTMWRGFLKEILCLLSVFPPEEQPRGRVRGPEKCPRKKRANFDHTMWKGWTFWLTWAGRASLCCFGFKGVVVLNLSYNENLRRKSKCWGTFPFPSSTSHECCKEKALKGKLYYLPDSYVPFQSLCAAWRVDRWDYWSLAQVMDVNEIN